MDVLVIIGNEEHCSGHSDIGERSQAQLKIEILTGEMGSERSMYIGTGGCPLRHRPVMAT